MKVVKRVTPKGFHHGEAFFNFYFFNSVTKLNDRCSLNYDNHIMMYVSQTIMLIYLKLLQGLPW